MVAMDLRGHGKSIVDNELDLSIEVNTNVLRALPFKYIVSII